MEGLARQKKGDFFSDRRFALPTGHAYYWLDAHGMVGPRRTAATGRAIGVMGFRNYMLANAANRIVRLRIVQARRIVNAKTLADFLPTGKS
jgi:hypothetical protein